MAVTIRVFGTTATIEDYQWTSPDRSVARLLTAATLLPQGESGAMPYADLAAAERAVKVFGGRIVRIDPIDAPPGRLY